MPEKVTTCFNCPYNRVYRKHNSSTTREYIYCGKGKNKCPIDDHSRTGNVLWSIIAIVAMIGLIVAINGCQNLENELRCANGDNVKADYVCDSLSNVIAKLRADSANAEWMYVRDNSIREEISAKIRIGKTRRIGKLNMMQNDNTRLYE